MEVAHTHGRTFVAATGEAHAAPADAVRVRRMPLTAGGELAEAALAGVAEEEETATGLRAGPLRVARAYAEEPKALVLGSEGYGPTLGDASGGALSAPAGAGPSSHVIGPPLQAAAAGGPRELATMCDALRDAAEHAGTARGIRFLSGGEASFESYAALLVSARQMLSALKSRLGLERGDAVALQIADARTHLRAFWGCVLGGITPVTVAVPNQYSAENATVRKLLGAIDVLDAKHVLASASGVGPLAALLSGDVRVHDATALLDSSAPADAGAEHDAEVSPDDVIFYQLTSGSTGTPKCIPERHAAVISHIRHSVAHCGYTAADVTLNWLPFDHVVPMLTFHLCDVYLQRAAVQLPTAEVISDPLLWPRAMAEHGVTHSWAPNFGFKLVVQAARATGSKQLPFDLSRVSRLMNAGEQVTAEVCDAFASVCGIAPSVLQPAFGMAECCTCMTYNNAYDSARSTVRVLKRR